MGVKWLNTESPLLSLKTLYTFNSIITKLLQYVSPTALYTWQTIKFLPFQPVNCYLWYSDTAGEIQLCLCKSNKANIKYKMKAGELHFSSRPAKDWTTQAMLQTTWHTSKIFWLIWLWIFLFHVLPTGKNALSVLIQGEDIQLYQHLWSDPVEGVIWLDSLQLNQVYYICSVTNCSSQVLILPLGIFSGRI